MKDAHGGLLIEQTLPQGESKRVCEGSDSFLQIPVSHEKVQEIFNITNGVFSPLRGFMGQEDYQSVIIRSRLASDVPWTIPIVLDVSKEMSGKLSQGQQILLAAHDAIVGLMEVGDVFTFDKHEYAKSVFGTDNKEHPGVAKVFGMQDTLVGGNVFLVSEPENAFERYTLRPKETRVLFQEKGWVDIVGFQTRNVPHLGHEYVQKTALSFVDGVFINPVIGRKKKGDFKDEVILASYEELIKHYYLKERAVMSILRTEMRYAGPKEAIHHAIMRKNFGCTHFIIGRDHAGVGSYYEPFAAHKIFDDFPDLEIVPIFFRSFFKCKKCGSIANDKTCPHSGDDIINFSGTKIRGALVAGEVPSAEMMRPEVANVILGFKQPFVE